MKTRDEVNALKNSDAKVFQLQIV